MSFFQSDTRLPMSTTVGEVTNSGAEFEWSIADFFSLREEKYAFYRSPILSHFSGASWYLRLYPIDSHDDISDRWIGIYLMRGDSGPLVSLTFTLALKTVDGKKLRERSFKFVFDKMDSGYGSARFLTRSRLAERKFELAPSDVLTITCSLRQDGPEDLKSGNEGRVESSTQTDAELKKLLQNLNGLMTNGDDSDLTIRVKEEEFRLHRCILGARTPVFSSMFRHEMIEKTTGIVCIDDCEEDTFRAFLNYVYTGAVDKLSPENVFGLYEVADKYQVDELKVHSLEYIKNILSVDTLCEAIGVALTHDEKELMELVVDLLSEKTVEIMMTVKWQNFLLQNPIQANELLIKAAVRNKSTFISSQQTTTCRGEYAPQSALKAIPQLDLQAIPQLDLQAIPQLDLQASPQVLPQEFRFHLGVSSESRKLGGFTFSPS